MIILGIETSCDETAAAVYDSSTRRVTSNVLFSQVDLHTVYGGVVPEIASRSHLEKIDVIVTAALQQAGLALADVDVVAVTQQPGLVGSLLIGICFAKGIAWAQNKKLIGVNHLEGHVFSAFLDEDGNKRDIAFPYLALSVSGGHTAFYLVRGFGDYEKLGGTIDDAAGEAFDKIATIMGLGYPGGPLIEKLAAKAGNEDYFAYPRGKNKDKSLNVSFSGLKTAVLYDLIKRGAFVMGQGVVPEVMTDELRSKVASSLQCAIADVFANRLQLALQKYPEIQAIALVGGVSANQFIVGKLRQVCEGVDKELFSPPLKFCGDNGAMIAFVGAYKAEQGKFDDFDMDVAR